MGCKITYFLKLKALSSFLLIYFANIFYLLGFQSFRALLYLKLFLFLSAMIEFCLQLNFYLFRFPIRTSQSPDSFCSALIALPCGYSNRTLNNCKGLFYDFCKIFILSCTLILPHAPHQTHGTQQRNSPSCLGNRSSLIALV